MHLDVYYKELIEFISPLFQYTCILRSAVETIFPIEQIPDVTSLISIDNEILRYCQ